MNALLMRARWLFDVQGDLPRLALGGAWLFATGSLFPLLWLIGAGGNGYVFHSGAGGHEHSVPLLAYSGWPGFLLLWAELLAVSGAIILTAAPRFVPLKWQRIGHGVLIGWNALWALGAWRLGVVDPGFWTFQAMFLTVLGACTLYRAKRNWTPAPCVPTLIPDEPPSPATTEIENKIGEPPSPVPASPNFFAEGVAQSPPASSRRQQVVDALRRVRDGAISAWRRGATAFRSGMNNSPGDEHV